MNQQEILKKIGGIIAELKEQYSYLEASADSFNVLELELFMANAHFLTDHIEILKKIQGQAKPVALPPAPLVLPVEKVYGQRPEIPDYFSEEEHLVSAEDTVPFKIKDAVPAEKTEAELQEIPMAATIKHETFVLPETMPQQQAEELPVAAEDAYFTRQKFTTPEIPVVEDVVISEPEVKPAAAQPQVEVPALPQLQPEKFMIEPGPVKPEPQPETIKPEPVKPESEQVLTLNQRIAAQKGLDQTQVAETQMATKPGQDLPSLITLNDKLLFVRELFNGYNLAYSEAINILNRYTNFEQAENFLKINYAAKNNWKDKPATTEKFYGLLRKRFS
ncbi:hypothetical protein [Mucilaginibacter arboris]|uniref:Uncharacterized protein n=1 Tax=Mucilaginibacter arboris TaxID=2682090 RepID=A0A7K1SWT6_9SPHI|nr:hypothetical protein [Mucilaginibacter arboris]MVN21530.1 hypothetical protein [Mucilaginibacter arboris]